MDSERTAVPLSTYCGVDSIACMSLDLLHSSYHHVIHYRDFEKVRDDDMNAYVIRQGDRSFGYGIKAARTKHKKEPRIK